MEKVIIVVLIGLFGWFIYFTATHECIEGHYETQIQMPVSTVVGGSNGYGGVAIPLGNAKEVETYVCDSYGKSIK